MTAKQQKNQMKLAFPAEGRGEAPKAAGGGTEVVRAGYGTENPASPECLMEEVCQRDNLVKALTRVKANQGSPGIDGMRVEELPDYLKEHWPRIREQLLQGAYQRIAPQALERFKLRVLELTRTGRHPGPGSTGEPSYTDLRSKGNYLQTQALP